MQDIEAHRHLKGAAAGGQPVGAPRYREILTDEDVYGAILVAGEKIAVADCVAADGIADQETVFVVEGKRPERINRRCLAGASKWTR